MALFLIGQPIWLLDFSAQINRMADDLGQWIDEQLSQEMTQYRLFLQETSHAADKALKKLALLNERGLRNAEGLNRTSQLAVNQYLLHIFKRWQDLFLRLDWSDTPIVGHQHYLVNCTCLEKAIKALENRDGEAALKNLCLIEDEYISRFFSKEVVDHFTKQVTASNRIDNQFWGTGRIVDSLDLYDLIDSIQSTVSDGGNQDWTSEICQLERSLEEEKNSLKQALVDEMQGLVEMQGLFEDIHFDEHITRLMLDQGLKNK